MKNQTQTQLTTESSIKPAIDSNTGKDAVTPSTKVKTVPQDFPSETRVKDADPSVVILGPQSPRIQQMVSHQISEIHGVSDTWVRQTSPQNNGPLEVLVYTEHNDSEKLCDQLSNNSTVTPDGHTHTVQVEQARTNSRAIPPENPTASVIIYQHPLLPDIRRTLNQNKDVSDYKINWGESGSSLGLSSFTVDWDSLGELYLSFSTAEDTPPNRVAKSLHQAIVTETPWDYITQITQVDASETAYQSLHGDDTVYEITFTDRERQSHSLSGVYNKSAEEIDVLIDEVTTKRNRLQDRARSEQLTLSGDGANGFDEHGIQLTVTSPVYLNAIDYDSYTEDKDVDWSGSDESADYSETDKLLKAWKKQQEDIFTPVFEATQEGGYCAVVIGHVKGEQENEWVDIPGHFTSVMRDIGWTFHEKIVWQKIGSEGKRFGTTKQNNRPTYYYPFQMHEEIQIWRKGDITHPSEDDIDERIVDSKLFREELKTNVWTVPTVPPNTDIDHPCPYPEEIVRRLLALYSKPNDIICDPLSGSGTTVKVADRFNRVGIGTELQATFTAEARRRLATEEFSIDPQHITSTEKEHNVDELRVTTTDHSDMDTTQTTLSDDSLNRS